MKFSADCQGASAVPSSNTSTRARARSVALECAAEPTPTVFLIGAGAMGTALGRRLVQAGVPVLGLHGRRAPEGEIAGRPSAGGISGALVTFGPLPALVAQADVIVIAVRDVDVPRVAQELRAQSRTSPRQVILHTSGSRSARDLLGALTGEVEGIGTMHPLVSVTGAPGTEDNLAGAACALEGDEAAVAMGKRLVGLMGGRPLRLKAEQMALYHAGAVFASNYVVALADVARSVLVAAGVAETDAQPALWPLLASVVRNLDAVGVPAGLTGPIVRGDVTAIERHLEALAGGAPEQLELYQRLGRETLRLSLARADGPSPEVAKRLADLFG
jgi:predicted short-subunit dehydrogenase-like oxidoreductase (DUF2520 family)